MDQIDQITQEQDPFILQSYYNLFDGMEESKQYQILFKRNLIFKAKQVNSQFDHPFSETGYLNFVPEDTSKPAVLVVLRAWPTLQGGPLEWDAGEVITAYTFHPGEGWRISDSPMD